MRPLFDHVRMVSQARKLASIDGPSSINGVDAVAMHAPLFSLRDKAVLGETQLDARNRAHCSRRATEDVFTAVSYGFNCFLFLVIFALVRYIIEQQTKLDDTRRTLRERESRLMRRIHDVHFNVASGEAVMRSDPTLNPSDSTPYPSNSTSYPYVSEFPPLPLATIVTVDVQPKEVGSSLNEDLRGGTEQAEAQRPSEV